MIEPRRVGRPRKWASNAERMRAYRARQREVNARLVDPEAAPAALAENPAFGTESPSSRTNAIGCGHRSVDCRPSFATCSGKGSRLRGRTTTALGNLVPNVAGANGRTPSGAPGAGSCRIEMGEESEQSTS
jgi:hypothetical protein